MIYIGIDVGKKGAIAAISPGGVLVFAQPLTGKEPDERAMQGLLLGFAGVADGDAHACIEQSRAMVRPRVNPKTGKTEILAQGARSAFNFGALYGLWRGMLVALEIPYEIVPPKTWQLLMLAGENKSDVKAASIRVAQRRWPNVSLLPTPRCRKPNDGMADALHIAEYGRRTHTGAPPAVSNIAPRQAPTEADLQWRADAEKAEGATHA